MVRPSGFSPEWERRLAEAREILGIKHSWRYYIETPAPERWERMMEEELQEHRLKMRAGNADDEATESLLEAFVRSLRRRN